MRWRSRSMSSTLTVTLSPIERISLGWFTCDHDSSEMWISPSMPSRSTNAPKSTILEIVPSTTWPAGLRRRLDPPPRALEPGALLGEDQPAVLVLFGEDERVDLLAEADLLTWIYRFPDRQLAGRNHALRLVADVDQHFVVVDPHD